MGQTDATAGTDSNGQVPGGVNGPQQNALYDLRQGAQCGIMPIWNVPAPETQRPCQYCKQVPRHYKTETQYGRTYKFYRCGCKSPLIEGLYQLR